MRPPLSFLLVGLCACWFTSRAAAQDASLKLGPPATTTKPSLILGPPAPKSVTPSSTKPPTEQEQPKEPEHVREADADQPKTEGGLVEYLATRFSPLDPIYFLYGTEAPNIKFQFSLKYQVIGPDGSIARVAPWATGFYLGYSQTSFWDVSSESRPFFDSSYRPEVLYLYEQHDPHWLPGMTRFDFQTGLKHESNGKSGDESRSLNVAYVQPVFTWGDPGFGGDRGHKGFFVAVSPRFFEYVFSLRDNPDIAEYRGYGDLKIITGWRGGLQLSATGRLGSDWDKGALQLDLSYPLRNITGGNLDLYLYGQFFTGFGESLLEYDESDTSFRIGVALVR